MIHTRLVVHSQTPVPSTGQSTIYAALWVRHRCVFELVRRTVVGLYAMCAVYTGFHRARFS